MTKIPNMRVTSKPIYIHKSEVSIPILIAESDGFSI